MGIQTRQPLTLGSFDHAALGFYRLNRITDGHGSFASNFKVADFPTMLDELHNVTKRNYPIDEAQSYLGRTDVENDKIEDGTTQKMFSRDGHDSSAARSDVHNGTINCGSRQLIETWMTEVRCMD
ncbi:uncharacterized protein EAE98_004283 [Botrytis deweyae]|uniref:Uncharacterized protein n=1 Tax=Botrytis deweyae TaxID=2478750 RepID=A0ABQ7IQG0_9HELO|nr:uncharacterized protein EAE98_004283 [Botrytis deweyae]KAF7931547.1 hypothetical protein EAE98_004283 [Botrytis deweyae]